MSDGFLCDGCGSTLLLDADVRYVLRIQGYAAYDPMEITASDLERDLEGEMAGLLRALEERDPESLQDEVYKEFRLDLCPRCWKEYRRDPLAGLRKAGERGEER